MILEGIILFGIQHFQQGRCRVTAEIFAEFIDFVQQDKRITGTSLFNSRHDATGHRPHIGAPVTHNFAFIVHAA